MDKLLPHLMSNLIAQSPVLLVYLAGMILALVFWRRCPGPCALTLIAMGLLLLTSIGQTFVSLYLQDARSDLDLKEETWRWMLSMNALVGSGLRALAFVLLLAAVFVDRKPRVDYRGYY